MTLFKTAFYLLVGLIIVFLPSLSLAEVDGDEGSVEKDRTHFGATETIRKTTKYKIYDLETSKRNLHEYVDTSGHVFAVTWDGGTPPDLAVIFGKHFNEYEKTLRIYPRIKGHRNFQSLVTSKLIINQFGHLGHYNGSAFLLGHLPENVTMAQIMKDSAEN